MKKQSELESLIKKVIGESIVDCHNFMHKIHNRFNREVDLLRCDIDNLRLEIDMYKSVTLKLIKIVEEDKSMAKELKKNKEKMKKPMKTLKEKRMAKKHPDEKMDMKLLKSKVKKSAMK